MDCKRVEKINTDPLSEWRKDLLKRNTNKQKYKHPDILSNWRTDLINENTKNNIAKNKPASKNVSLTTGKGKWRQRKDNNKLDYIQGLKYLGMLSSNVIFPPSDTESIEHREILYRAALIGHLLRRGNNICAGKLGKVFGKPKKFGINMNFTKYIETKSNIFKINGKTNQTISLKK